MQDQGASSNAMCDEVHEVDSANEQQDYTGPVTRSRAKAQDHIDSSASEESQPDQEDKIMLPGKDCLSWYMLKNMKGGQYSIPSFRKN